MPRSGPNLEFQKVFEAKWSSQALDEDSAQVDADSAHDHIARELWRSLASCLPAELVNELSPRLAVGALDNISVNAFCARSAEGHLAVLMNSGLMTLFNKLSKIYAATSDPSSIVYCNRTGTNPVSAETLRAWISEVCKHYRDTGQPLGPQIHLDAKGDSRHAPQLHVWEMFVLCHEIGHIVCGHLDSPQFMLENPSLGMVQTLAENKDHVMEAEADLVGFLLLREYATKGVAAGSLPQDDDRWLLGTLITLFNLFHSIGAAESRSHPHPLDRLCNVTAAVYGEQLAEVLARSYDNYDLLAEVFRNPICPQTEVFKKGLNRD
jgi:hypothetical protein